MGRAFDHQPSDPELWYRAQQASKDINTYLADIAPGNLVYDKHLKGYKPSDSFSPKLTSGHADEYLHILSRSEDMTVTFNELDMGFEHSTMVRPVTRNISPQVLRPLVQAIREKKTCRYLLHIAKRW